MVFSRKLEVHGPIPQPLLVLPIDPKTKEPISYTTADLDYTGTIMPPPNSSYPKLSEDEKMLFARWVDLGAPISQYPAGTPSNRVGSSMS